jgi:uncharacterized protein YecT (DUF1311 family)
LPIARRVLTDRNAVVDIRLAYPATGDARIDADLVATVQTIAQGFRKEAAETHDPHDSPYTLNVSYEIARNDAKLFAVIFIDEWDMHGAHPNLEILAANYLRAGSFRVYLPELFEGAPALKRIAALATAALDRQLLTPNALTDADWIARGADAHWDNFDSFALLPDALEIVFPPYRVASFAAGPITIRLPLNRLRDMMRADPYAPVASFDCAQAAMPNEHAICAQVALARLDREMGETFSSEIRGEDDPVRQEALRRQQRAWLTERDQTCRSAAALDARIACLTGFYRNRLAVLRAGP